jgi:hypothetical protein
VPGEAVEAVWCKLGAYRDPGAGGGRKSNADDDAKRSRWQRKNLSTIREWSTSPKISACRERVLRLRLVKPLILCSQPGCRRALHSKHLDAITFNIAMAIHYPVAFEGEAD